MLRKETHWPTRTRGTSEGTHLDFCNHSASRDGNGFCLDAVVPQLEFLPKWVDTRIVIWRFWSVNDGTRRYAPDTSLLRAAGEMAWTRVCVLDPARLHAYTAIVGYDVL